MSALVQVRNLIKEFGLGRLFSGGGPAVRAVDDVSFSIDHGETLALVGESGSGKTTTGRCLLRLIEPTAGTIEFDGTDLRALGPAALRRIRRRMQLVFQDPCASLNPRMRAGDIVMEPLHIHRVGSRADRAARVREMFELVGLRAEHLARYPSEFSGGQRQRIGIARALVLAPSLVVADEPVSSLDVSVQAQIVRLLRGLQERLGVAYLFITHDLHVARAMAGRIAVMYRGRVVEVAPPEGLFRSAVHPYTRALLSTVLTVNGRAHDRLRFAPETFEALPLTEVGPSHLAAVK